MVSEEVKTKVNGWIADNHVFVASKSWCPHCKATIQLLKQLKQDAHIEQLDQIPDGAEIQEYLGTLTGQTTVPSVFIKGQHIGGNSDLQALHKSGKLSALL